MIVSAVWLRLELRRRWRSLTVLALLVAFATATVLAAVAGARRGDTAVERLLAQTRPATAVALPNQPGFDWDEIRALPEVEGVATFAVSGVFVDGVPGEAVGFPPGDDELMRTLERPVVVAGRLADPKRLDEVVVTPRFPETYGKGVGDSVTMRLASPAEMDRFQAGTLTSRKVTGPVIRARIVGVVKSVWVSDDIDGGGSLGLTPAVLDRYPANILGTEGQVPINALVRLRGGEAALPEFRADLARVSGRADIEVWNLAEQARHWQKVAGFEAFSLLAFGLAALVAAIMLIGQSVARYTAATVADLAALRPVGMTPRQLTAAASAGPLLAAVVGATFGVAGAVAASYWMPIGAAALVEPHPGIDVDWLVLVVGWLTAPLAVLGAGVAAAWFALDSARARLAPRRSAVAARLARAGVPVPVVTGARFALEPGRGRSAVPVRPALFGAVTGVLGVLAAFTFSAGVSDAVGNLERFGQTHELVGWFGANGRDLGPADDVLPLLAEDSDVAAVNDARVAVASAGKRSVALYTFDPVSTSLPVVLTTGSMPAAAGEVVLAPTSARLLGAEVGSTVRLEGTEGTHPYRVAGIGFVPTGPHNSYDEGGWVTPGGYDQLFTGFKFHMAQVALRPGADPDAVVARLQRSAGAVTGGEPISLESVEPPPQAAEIRGVRVLPVVLGGFLALLAVGAVGHALGTAVRRRRFEVAVMRALGMTRRQSRLVVVVQATLLALVGLLFGVPLGLALGRTLWRLVADYTPLHYVPPVAFWVLVLVAPVAVVVANALAAWPGQRAARLHVGHALRTE